MYGRKACSSFAETAPSQTFAGPAGGPLYEPPSVAWEEPFVAMAQSSGISTPPPCPPTQPGCY
jgi:hypothetical protein